MNAHRITAGITLAAIYGLIILGGWVRANNAGLSCPDWPTCYGQWVLTPAEFAALGDVGYTYYEMMLEWLHRFMAAAIVGPLILALAVFAFRKRRVDAAGWYLAIGLFVLLYVQKSLGGFTVFDKNSPWSVALHLSTALMIFSLVVLIFVRASNRASAPAPRSLAILATFVWVLALGTMATAAMTAKSGASLACYSWPSCDGQFLPDLADPQILIHFIHRKLALTTGLGVISLYFAARWLQHEAIWGLAKFSAFLIVGQMALGALVILLEVPQWSQVAHQGLGVFLFSILSALMWKAWRGNGQFDEVAGHASLYGAR